MVVNAVLRSLCHFYHFNPDKLELERHWWRTVIGGETRAAVEQSRAIEITRGGAN
jgi:hypothetical protein